MQADEPLCGLPDDLLNSTSVKSKCGEISDMTIFRWTRELSFPQPDVVIQGRKFWHRQTIDQWIAGRKQAQQRTAKPKRSSGPTTTARVAA